VPSRRTSIDEALTGSRDFYNPLVLLLSEAARGED
jgi:hypothetical protein